MPKPGGGRRPIGLLPTIVRVWERIRTPILKRWAGDNARAYDWATQGRSVEGAAWHQALLDEAATAENFQSATTFTDLTKAFEMVRFQDVWQAGCRYRFPPRLLRLMLEAFSFGRRLTYIWGRLGSDPHLDRYPRRCRFCADCIALGPNGRFGLSTRRVCPTLANNLRLC